MIGKALLDYGEVYFVGGYIGERKRVIPEKMVVCGSLAGFSRFSSHENDTHLEKGSGP